MIKAIIISVFIGYALYFNIFFFFFVGCKSFLNLFSKNFFFSYIVLVFDYIYFLSNILGNLIFSIYSSIIDLLIGQNLIHKYTDTDLNFEQNLKERSEWYDEEGNYIEEMVDRLEEEMEILEKEFDLTNFEYVYSFIRISIFFRCLYLTFNTIVSKMWRTEFLRPISPFFFMVYKNYINCLFYISKGVGLTYWTEKFWESILRIRTHIFIFIYHDYFFSWIYSFLNWNLWKAHAEKGDAPFNELEPSEKFYRFFIKFNKSSFLRNFKTLKIRFNFITGIIFFFYAGILWLVNKFIEIINKNFYFLTLIKYQYKVAIKFYKVLLKWEYLTVLDGLKKIKNLFKNFLSLFIIFLKPKIILVKINILWNLSLIYLSKIFDSTFSKILIVLNTIILNIIIIIIKLFPLIIYSLNYLKGTIALILFIYYVNTDTLILALTYGLDWVYYFYQYNWPGMYEAFNDIDFYPLSHKFGMLPYWYAIVLNNAELAMFNTQFFPNLELLPEELLIDGQTFMIGSSLVSIIPWLGNRHLDYLKRREYNLQYIAWFKVHYFHYKTLWYHTIPVIKSYFDNSYSWFLLKIPFELLYLKIRIFYCWLYLLTAIGLNIIFIPYLWYYFLLQNIIFSSWFKIIDFIIVNVTTFLYILISVLLNSITYIFTHYIKMLIFFLYDFSIFCINNIYTNIINFITKMYLLKKNVIDLLEFYSPFFSQLYNSLYVQSLKWFFFISTNNAFVFNHFSLVNALRENNDYYDLVFFVLYELLNGDISFFLHYKFLGNSSLLEKFFKTDLNEALKLFLYTYLFIYISVEFLIDYLSLNFDQVRIYYFYRLDIDAQLYVGELSKRIKKHVTAIRKRWVTNRYRKSSICSYGNYDSFFMMAFFFMLYDIFFNKDVKIDYWLSKNIIYSQYYWQNNHIFLVEYVLLGLLICTIAGFLFPRACVFLNCKSSNLNPEYCWYRFRKSESKDILWLFTDVNVFVSDYFKNKHLDSGASFRKKFESDQDFVEIIEQIKKIRDTGIVDISTSYLEELAENQYVNVWRGYWLEEFASKLKIYNKDKLLDPNFNFSLFYFDPDYNSYYNLYLKQYLFLYGLMLYGVKRNKFLENAFLNEGMFRIIPQFHNKEFYNNSKMAESIKNFFYKLDDNLYYEGLPWWSLHKDLFNFQIVSTKPIYEHAGEMNSQTRPEDEKYFLIDSPSFYPPFFSYWAYGCVGFILGKYFFAYPRFTLMLRHELQFYVYGYLGRIWIFNQFFEIFSGVYWGDCYGDRKKAPSEVRRRRKIKRRYKSRWRYLLDVNIWGPFCWWQARKSKNMYFVENFYLIYIYLKYILMYILISLCLSTVILKIFFKNLYKTESMVELGYYELKKFWFSKLYLQQINNTKLKFYKKW